MSTIVRNSKKTLDELLIEKQNIEKELESHKASISLLKEKLDKINRKIGKAQLENQLADGIMVSVVSPKPWLLNESGRKINDLFKGDTVRIIDYDKKTDKLKVYTKRYDTVGYLVPIAFGDNLVVKEYINSITYKSINEIEQNFLIKDFATIYHYPSDYSSAVKKFENDGLKVVDYQNKFFLIESSNGIKGFVSEYGIGNSDEYRKATKSSIASNLEKHSQPIYIQSIFVDNINSASGVDFSLDWAFLDDSKTVKYLYVSVKPYNSVGDQQRCGIGGHSLFEGKITGPISAETNLRQSTWKNAWYNNTITCLSIVKVKVEYMDGTNYTYINELPKILNPNLQNDCRY
jgi:hypothetical protein